MYLKSLALGLTGPFGMAAGPLGKLFLGHLAVFGRLGKGLVQRLMRLGLALVNHTVVIGIQLGELLMILGGMIRSLSGLPSANTIEETNNTETPTTPIVILFIRTP